MSLESCPDDMQTFRKATGHDDLKLVLSILYLHECSESILLFDHPPSFLHFSRPIYILFVLLCIIR